MSSESEMKKATSSSHTPLSLFYRCPRLMQTMSWVGSLGLLSSGLVVAQTESFVDTTIAPAAAPAQQAVEPAAPALAPAVAPAPAAAPKPAAPAPAPAPAPAAAPKPAASAPAPAPEAAPSNKPALSAPNLVVPNASNPSQPPKVYINPETIQESATNPVDVGNSYIDTTDYSIGATEGYSAPSSVVLSDRSSGCQTVSQNGQLSNAACGGQTAPAPTRQTANAAPTTVNSNPRQLTNVRTTSAQPRMAGNTRLSPPRVISAAPIEGPLSIPVRRLRPTQLQSKPLDVSHYYNVTARPTGRAKIQEPSFMYPLLIPAPVTSLFGWRQHPITGDYRFHAGTDIGAPQGTPVIAAASGKVATANFIGGYGLSVILRHEKDTQESRYAHLSEIYVQPGEWVEQGTVIGRVGSTGLSTGPHLHFEWRHKTDQGWVAVDAGAHLEYSLAQFIQYLQVAHNRPQQPAPASATLQQAARDAVAQTVASVEQQPEQQVAWRPLDEAEVSVRLLNQTSHMF